MTYYVSSGTLNLTKLKPVIHKCSQPNGSAFGSDCILGRTGVHRLCGSWSAVVCIRSQLSWQDPSVEVYKMWTITYTQTMSRGYWSCRTAVMQHGGVVLVRFKPYLKDQLVSSSALTLLVSSYNL